MLGEKGVRLGRLFASSVSCRVGSDGIELGHTEVTYGIHTV
jgi:hypothetical protein